MNNDFSSTLTELATLEHQINTKYENVLNVHRCLNATGTKIVKLSENDKKKINIQVSLDIKAGGKPEKGKIPECEICAKKHLCLYRKLKQKRNDEQGGGPKYKGFQASKKTCKYIKISVFAKERKKKEKQMMTMEKNSG